LRIADPYDALISYKYYQKRAQNQVLKNS